MKKEDKLKLIILTAILDTLFIYVLKLTNTSFNDRIFIALLLTVHSAFYYALWTFNQELIKVLHILVYVFIGASLYVDSVWIQKICLALTLLIKHLWEVEGRCILKLPGENFGYDEEIEKFTNAVAGSLTSAIISKYDLNHWLLDIFM